MDAIQPILTLIGGGNMARAIFDGGAASGVLDAHRVIVAEPLAERRVYFTGRGCAAFQSVSEAALEQLRRETQGAPGIVLLAIKPQALPFVAPELRRVFPTGDSARVVLSILAGTPTHKLQDALGDSWRIVRAMPNMPAQIGRGCTALCIGPGATWADAEVAERLFQAVGPLVIRIAEDMMDAFTALCGSGPAYLFYLAQSMVEAGIRLGFGQSDAERIVRQTLAGSGELFARSTHSADTLLAGVQSRRGTTEAAVNVLTRAAVHEALIAAITAARDRGRELSL